MKIGKEYISALPVAAISDEVNRSLADTPRLVVTAPPGSGKSTLLPLTIFRDAPEGKVIMLEPRRAAARQIAMRMARMRGETVGETVGYRMRFESRVSTRTRIEVVTEGVMERMLIDDPTLDGISTVIFDEFHERSLTSDLTLALTLQAQEMLRPDLRIVIMSATIDTETLCHNLHAPLIQAQGRMYDVTVINGEDIDIRDNVQAIVPAVVSTVRRAYREQTGNILVFLPGQAEIARCLESLDGIWPDAVVMPLYGTMPPEKQYHTLEYNPEGIRKIVLSTPIAETSLTIEGIKTVVDSGLYRQVRYNVSTGLSRLETERITMDMARQRAGRAGRLSEGVCYRLWSRAAELRMHDTREPEIENADLSSMLLNIAAWGGTADSLPWITPPQSAHLAEARKLLTLLGAIDQKDIITPHGRKMAALPCHPRIANMLLRASDNRLRALSADIAAILEDKDPVKDDNDADINTRIILLRQYRRGSGGAPGGVWWRIDRISAQYRKLTGCTPDNSPVDPDDTGMLIASAYPERVAMRLKDNVYRLPNGENVKLNDKDDLSACDTLAVASMGQRIFMASPVGIDTLQEISVPHRNVTWNSHEGRLIARDELRIGVLVAGWRQVDNLDHDTAVRTICRAAVKDGRSMLDFNDDVAALQMRIATVASWHPELSIPDVTTDALLATVSEWLPLYIGNSTSRQELRKIDMQQVIAGIVGYELMQTINRLAPTRIQLPGGRNAKIEYRAGSSAPVVSARLQDCLGMFDTPRIDDRRRQVLMELLSPGFKPVQLTQDLRGFWTTTYFEVRKELRRRYPKHRWPDDPFNP